MRINKLVEVEKGVNMKILSGSFFYTPSKYIDEDFEATYRICMDLQERGLLVATKGKTESGETHVQYKIKFPESNNDS